MKKFISLFLVIALLCCVSVSVSAAEGDQELVEYGSASATITYTQPSDYVVYIPYTMEFIESYRFEAQMLNIVPESEYVMITVSNLDDNNCLEFTHTISEGVTFKATPTKAPVSSDLYVPSIIPDNCAAIFNENKISNLYFYWQIPESTGIVKAGSYTATAQFSVGLYGK